MTQLLEKAFAELSSLSESEQDAIAAWLLEELTAERRWEKLLSESPEVLASLADQALAEHHTGLTEPLDSNNL